MDNRKKRGSEDGAHHLSEPGDIFIVQAVMGGRPADDSLYPARVAQDLEVLGDGSLGDGQVVLISPVIQPGCVTGNCMIAKRTGLPRALNMTTSRSCSAPEMARVQQDSGKFIASPLLYRKITMK